MLDVETRRRIDTARDILVGKVPDPKSQVEQITIALIYKFMDDMDAESEEFGGKRKFFAGEFARYGWPKLLRSGLGGYEMLNLYAEAIAKMPENPGVPLLFRDIFKNAYLPYRDPETLREFLKIIDDFTYDHSERLGDAFEYLLSVLGSQGDAGQFRTPRHIIDFMVRIVAPKKNEIVLDPACGTAGFLISSYKHILSTNINENGRTTLTPDERTRLADNFKGYDISPDMVRLSLVNMYLHGFADPHIYEYDTLTSQDRWNEYADVILANPPFMSPKGGIKPHNRFSVQSKRSEVLFVDYMLEHLTPTGRAGIIVPEGIIFQSQNAYKQLREMLVNEALVAVISLPAGVFQPYSGVKTSILILDKALAKKTKHLAFFKVEIDGFDLGAQRRPTDKDDLPRVRAEIADYLHRLNTGHSLDDFQPSMGLVVEKGRVAENGDYNLSGERYRESVISQTQWPLVALSEICEFRSGLWKGDKEPLRVVKILRNTNFTKNGFLDLSDVAEHPVEVKQLESRLLEYGDIILEKSGGGPTQPVGRVALFNVENGEYSFSNFTARIRVTDKRANPFFVWLCLNHFYQTGRTERLQKQTSGIRNLDNSSYQQTEIPLPPLSVQQEIVAEVESYQKVIDGARAVLENYRVHVAIHPSWSMVNLGEICSFKNGLNFNRDSTGFSVNIVGVKDFQANLYAPIDNLDSVQLDSLPNDDYFLQEGDVLFVRSNGNPDLVGRSMLMPKVVNPTTFSGFTIRGRFDDVEVLPQFYAYFFKSRDFAERIKTVGQGANIRNLSQRILSELQVPLPPLETQQAIVSEIETEQALVNANRELITRFEQKIQTVLARVWGEGEVVTLEEK